MEANIDRDASRAEFPMFARDSRRYVLRAGDLFVPSFVLHRRAHSASGDPTTIYFSMCLHEDSNWSRMLGYGKCSLYRHWVISGHSRPSVLSRTFLRGLLPRCCGATLFLSLKEITVPLRSLPILPRSVSLLASWHRARGMRLCRSHRCSVLVSIATPPAYEKKGVQGLKELESEIRLYRSVDCEDLGRRRLVRRIIALCIILTHLGRLGLAVV